MNHLATYLHAPTRKLTDASYRSGWQEKELDLPPAHEPRHLIVLFRRNPEQDTQSERIRYEGYQIFWPDGEPVSVGLSRLCQQGCRLLGLGRRMRGKHEQLCEVGIYPVTGLEAPLTRLGPGIRSRRFFIEKHGQRGKFFFFNGSPTEVEFDAEQDDPRVVSWLGLQTIPNGERLWLDLSARSLTEDESAAVMNQVTV